MSPVGGTTKQKHVVSMTKWRKFCNNMCLRLKYIIINLSKENTQLKYIIAAIPLASILQHIVYYANYKPQISPLFSYFDFEPANIMDLTYTVRSESFCALIKHVPQLEELQ
jgi:hypothetical protein